MPAAWPLSSSLCFRPGTWREQPQPNIVTFDPDVGEILTRRRSTAKAWLGSGLLVITSLSSLEVFWSFYETALADGSLAFEAGHPKTHVVYEWMFAEPPPAQNVGGVFHDIPLSLIRLP